MALERFISFSTEQCKNLFFRWDFSVNCFAIVVKLVETVFTTLPFWTLSPTWLNLFGLFKINSADDWKKPGKKLSAKLSKGTRLISEKMGTLSDCFSFTSPNIQPCMLTEVGGNEWRQTTKREHGWRGYDCCITHQNSVRDFPENKSRVWNHFAIANTLNREQHNYFIQILNTRLLRRVCIAGNARALFSLGCNHLFEPQIALC